MLSNVSDTLYHGKINNNISKAILERIWLFCEISFVLRRLHSFFVCGRFGSTAVLHTRTKPAFKKVWVSFTGSTIKGQLISKQNC